MFCLLDGNGNEHCSDFSCVVYLSVFAQRQQWGAAMAEASKLKVLVADNETEVGLVLRAHFGSGFVFDI